MPSTSNSRNHICSINITCFDYIYMYVKSVSITSKATHSHKPSVASATYAQPCLRTHATRTILQERTSPKASCRQSPYSDSKGEKGSTVSTEQVLRRTSTKCLQWRAKRGLETKCQPQSLLGQDWRKHITAPVVINVSRKAVGGYPGRWKMEMEV